MTMRPMFLPALLVVLLPLVGHAAPPIFPPDATRDLDDAVPFGVLKAQPDTYTGRAVTLGGKIVAVEETDQGLLILVKNLPIAEHPVYGPVEIEGVTGEQFAVLYQGRVDPEGLWFGNKLMVVAVAQGNRNVLTPSGVIRSRPFVLARCMHVWKTGEYGSYEISDFPHTTDGYYSLPQETYCARR
jgi:starvation-inducible outer membrane lipoprotein